MATAKEVASHLDVSDRTIRDLQSRGVLPQAARGALDLDACRIAYIQHLRERAAGRQGEAEPGNLDLVHERARLAKEQADRIASRNAIDRGELVAISAVTQAVVSAIELSKARLMRVPAIVAKADSGLKERIATAIEDALEDLSAVRVEAVASEGDDGGEDPSDADD